jgi:hypothetical protein
MEGLVLHRISLEARFIKKDAAEAAAPSATASS